MKNWAIMKNIIPNVVMADENPGARNGGIMILSDPYILNINILCLGDGD